MALFGSFASRFARPAGKVLDAPIREIVHEVLREHGYASPAEVQALRDELRDLKTRVDGLGRTVGELSAVAEEARAEAAAARAEATRPFPTPVADPRIGALEARVAELEAALEAATIATAAASAAPPVEPPAAEEPEHSNGPRVGCKVDSCPEAVRSKGFCSAHYQQWRRGTLKGFVTAEATILVGERIVHLPKDTIGEAVRVDSGKVVVNGVVVA